MNKLYAIFFDNDIDNQIADILFDIYGLFFDETTDGENI
jgi:hypothetical protein